MKPERPVMRVVSTEDLADVAAYVEDIHESAIVEPFLTTSVCHELQRVVATAGVDRVVAMNPIGQWPAGDLLAVLAAAWEARRARYLVSAAKGSHGWQS